MNELEAANLQIEQNKKNAKEKVESYNKEHKITPLNLNPLEAFELQQPLRKREIKNDLTELKKYNIDEDKINDAFIEVFNINDINEKRPKLNTYPQNTTNLLDIPKYRSNTYIGDSRIDITFMDVFNRKDTSGNRIGSHKQQYQQEYFMVPEHFKERREYLREYQQRPDVKKIRKKYFKEYNRTQERKEYFKEYSKTPERKEYLREYQRNRYHIPKIKKILQEYAREYRQRPDNIQKMKEYQKRYREEHRM